jgi:hypothetical protein
MGEDEIKATEEELETTEDLIETEEETITEVEEEETEIVEEPKPEPVVEEEPKPKRKREYIHVAKYVGTAKKITLSGVGRIHPGKEFEVSENIANTLKLDENFEVRTTYKYIEV